jgi:hypothetical protein
MLLSEVFFHRLGLLDLSLVGTPGRFLRVCSPTGISVSLVDGWHLKTLKYFVLPRIPRPKYLVAIGSVKLDKDRTRRRKE